MESIKQAKTISKKDKNLESIKVIASIIIERVIEDQRSGNLRFKSKEQK